MGHWGLLQGVGGIGHCKGPSWGVWGVRGALGMEGGLGAQPHWAPVQGPSNPTGSPWGVTYLTKGQPRIPVEGPITATGFPWRVTYLAKAKQVTEMSSA